MGKPYQRVPATERRLVPGFPEIVERGSQCRYCALVDTHPELLRSIHDALREGSARGAVAATATAVHEAGLAPLTHQSLSRHRRHVVFDFAGGGQALPPALRAKADDEVGVRDLRDLAQVQQSADAAARARERIAEDEQGVGAYFELWYLAERLKGIVEKIDTSEATEPPKSGDEDMGKKAYALMIWLKVVKEMRQLLEAISRVRNSDRFTTALVNAAYKNFGMALSSSLREELGSVLVALEQGDAAMGTAQLRGLLEGGMADILIAARDHALAKSLDEYKVVH